MIGQKGTKMIKSEMSQERFSMLVNHLKKAEKLHNFTFNTFRMEQLLYGGDYEPNVLMAETVSGDFTKVKVQIVEQGRITKRSMGPSLRVHGLLDGNWKPLSMKGATK